MLFVLAAGLLAASPAAAQFDREGDRWVEYGQIGSRVQYIDSASVRSLESGVAQAWFLASSVPPDDSRHAASSRVLQLVRFKCDDYRYAILVHQYHEDGRMVNSFVADGEDWSLARPTSAAEKMLSAACGMVRN